MNNPNTLRPLENCESPARALASELEKVRPEIVRRLGYKRTAEACFALIRRLCIAANVEAGAAGDPLDLSDSVLRSETEVADHD